MGEDANHWGVHAQTRENLTGNVSPARDKVDRALTDWRLTPNLKEQFDKYEDGIRARYGSVKSPYQYRIGHDIEPVIGRPDTLAERMEMVQQGYALPKLVFETLGKDEAEYGVCYDGLDWADLKLQQLFTGATPDAGSGFTPLAEGSEPGEQRNATMRAGYTREDF